MILRTLLMSGALAGATCATCGAVGSHWKGTAPPTAEDLGLSGVSATQWTTLRDQTIDLRDSGRSALMHEFDKARAVLGSDAPDLDAFDRELEQALDAHAAAARALRQRKLAFYDGLAPDQQAKVRAVLLDRLNRLERIRAALMDATSTP